MMSQCRRLSKTDWSVASHLVRSGVVLNKHRFVGMDGMDFWLWRATLTANSWLAQLKYIGGVL